MPSTRIETLSEFKSVIASPKPVIICLCFESVNPDAYLYGCEKLLPKFEIMSNHAGFKGIDFYRVDCQNNPDIRANCPVQPPAFLIYQSYQLLNSCPLEDLRGLHSLIARYYSGPGVFPFPNSSNASRTSGLRVQQQSIN